MAHDDSPKISFRRRLAEYLADPARARELFTLDYEEAHRAALSIAPVRPPECRQCHECSRDCPDLLLPCHPIAGINDDEEAVFACKHCPRSTPWLDDDELEERQNAKG